MSKLIFTDIGSLSIAASNLCRLMLRYTSVESLLRKNIGSLTGMSCHPFSIAHMIALRQAGTETCLRSGMIVSLDKITGMRLAETAKSVRLKSRSRDDNCQPKVYCSGVLRVAEGQK